MYNQLQTKQGKIIIAALAGTTAGIIAGLLMASKSGSLTRKELVQGAFNVKDIVNNAINNYLSKQQSPQA